MKADHDIVLDDLLADAAQHLRDEHMLALAAAVDVARARLVGKTDVESMTRLRDLCSDDTPVQLTLEYY